MGKKFVCSFSELKKGPLNRFSQIFFAKLKKENILFLIFDYYFNKPKDMCRTPNLFGEALFVY